MTFVGYSWIVKTLRHRYEHMEVAEFDLYCRRKNHWFWVCFNFRMQIKPEKSIWYWAGSLPSSLILHSSRRHELYNLFTFNIFYMFRYNRKNIHHVSRKDQMVFWHWIWLQLPEEKYFGILHDAHRCSAKLTNSSLWMNKKKDFWWI